MKTSDSISDIAPAFVAAQNLIQMALKDEKNTFFNSKYATLGSVWIACKDALHEQGIAVLQGGKQNEEGEYELETMLLHTTGQWFSSVLPLHGSRQEKGKGWVDSSDPQAVGSVITYMRRYALAAMTGVVTADDDAEAGMQPHREQKEQPKAPPKPEQIAESLEKAKKAYLAIATDFPEHLSVLKDLLGNSETVNDVPAADLPKLAAELGNLYRSFYRDVRNEVIELETPFSEEDRRANRVRFGLENTPEEWEPSQSRLIGLRKYMVVLQKSQ